MKKLLSILFILINILLLIFVVYNLSAVMIFLFLLSLSAFLIMSYKSYAEQQGWRMGLLFIRDASFIKIISIIAIPTSFIASFFFIEWYYVLIGIVYVWLLSGAITGIFKQRTQIISFILLVLSLLFGLVLFIGKLIS